MSNDVKRYSVVLHVANDSPFRQTGDSCTRPQRNDVVLAADYAALEAERNELQRRLDAADEWATLASEQLKERDALAAELQALKAPCSEVPEVVAHRLINCLGEVITEWSDGPPPERITDLSGVVQTDVTVQVAYAAPPAAQDVSALPPFAEKVLAKLRRFEECAEDPGSGGVDIGRNWLDLLTQLALLNRVQRSPGLWEISQQGEDFLATHRPAQQQEGDSNDA